MEEICAENSNADSNSVQESVPDSFNSSSEECSIPDNLSSSLSDLSEMSYDEESADENSESSASDPELEEIGKLRSIIVSFEDCPAETSEQLAYRLDLIEIVLQDREDNYERRKIRRRHKHQHNIY